MAKGAGRHVRQERDGTSLLLIHEQLSGWLKSARRAATPYRVSGSGRPNTVNNQQNRKEVDYCPATTSGSP